MKLKKIKLLISFFVIFVFALFLRAYKLYERLPFTMDEEYQAFLVKRIIEGDHIPLIGVNVSDTGMYLGPFFTWLSVIPFWLTNLNPIGTGWFAAGIGVITTVVIAWATFQLTINLNKNTRKGRKEGLNLSYLLAGMAGLFYAINPLINFYDRKYWNPSFIPLLSVILLVSLWKYQRNKKWLIGIVVVFGLALHTHYSLFGLLPITIGWMVYLKRNELKNSSSVKGRVLSIKEKLNKVFRTSGFKNLILEKKYLVISWFIFFICVAPLLIFEIRHDFTQTKAVFNNYELSDNLSVEEKNEKPQSLFNKLNLTRKTVDRLFWIGFDKDLSLEITNCEGLTKSSPFIPFSIILVGLIVWMWMKYDNKKFTYLITGYFGSMVVSFVFFPGNVSEYYLLPLFPIAMIVLAIGIGNIMQSLQVDKDFSKLSGINIGIASIVITFGLVWTWQSLNFENHLGLKNKQKVFEFADKYVVDSKFNLVSTGKCFKYEGYRYLSEQNGLRPTKSYVDPNFGWLYDFGNDEQIENDLVIYDKKDVDSTEWGKWKGKYAEWKIFSQDDDISVMVLKRKPKLYQ